jgi:uncharacterized protein (DUF1697 family)
VLAKLKEIGSNYDDFHVNGRELYWYCRGGMSDSVIWKKMPKKLVSPDNTFRNVTTLQRLAAKGRSRG